MPDERVRAAGAAAGASMKIADRSLAIPGTPAALRELPEFDVDSPLTPPPASERKVKVRLVFVGEEQARIDYDLDRD